MSFEEALQTDAPGVSYCTNTAVAKSQKLAKVQRRHVRDETSSGLIATPPTKGQFGFGKLKTSTLRGAAAQAAAREASISYTGESNLPSSSGEAGTSDPHPAGQTPASDAQTPPEEVARTSTRTVMSRETEKKLLRDVVKAQLRDRLGKDNEADSRKIYTTLYSLCNVYMKSVGKDATDRDSFQRTACKFIDLNFELVAPKIRGRES